jgi:hypothetical protein
LTVDQLNETVQDIIDVNEDFGTTLAEIMKKLENSPEIAHDGSQEQYLTEFEGDFGQY